MIPRHVLKIVLTGPRHEPGQVVPIVDAVCVVNGVTITSTKASAQPLTSADCAWSEAKSRAVRRSWDLLLDELLVFNTDDRMGAT